MSYDSFASYELTPTCHPKEQSDEGSPWLRRRLRVYIWKQWKVPKARIRNLMKLGIPKYYAHKWGYIKAYWNVAGRPVLTRSITNERLAQAGYYSILARYESLHLCD